MKRTFLFLLASLILTLCAVQAEARTLYRSVTAPAIYWNFYNGYYAPMATRAYYSIPPAFRPVRVYKQPGVIPPQPVYYPQPEYYPETGNHSQQNRKYVPKKQGLSWKEESVLRRQKLVEQRKKKHEELEKLRAEHKKLNEQRNAQRRAESQTKLPQDVSLNSNKKHKKNKKNKKD